MKRVVKTVILDVINKSIPLIKKKDSAALGELSGHTIKNAGLYQDEDSITTAVIMHALSKIIGDSNCQDGEECNIEKELRLIEEGLKETKDSLEKNNFSQYNKHIKYILNIVESLDKKLKLYIDEVIERAEIKKGGKIYSSGISLAQSAQILGINHWQLMNYVGKTEIITTEDEILSIRNRLKTAREFLR